MPAPSPDLIARLGPETRPFERRRPPRRSVVAGEDILFDSFDATEGGLPPDCIKVPIASAYGQDKVGLYLWVIDQKGLRLLLEATPNPAAQRGVVCHTNITGGELALQGGELWFGEDDIVYVNNQSGRYGSETEIQQEAVIEYFRLLGFNTIQLPYR